MFCITLVISVVKWKTLQILIHSRVSGCTPPHFSHFPVCGKGGRSATYLVFCRHFLKNMLYFLLSAVTQCKIWRTYMLFVGPLALILYQLFNTSRKHAYIILTPLNPTFIYQNWGLQGYTLFFLFLIKNIDCGYSLEPPRRGGSNEYPQSMF